MCIVIYKPKGLELPSDEVMRNCWNNNSHGAGFMYNKDGAVYINKGFFSVEDFIKTVRHTVKKSQHAILHFRIATHGGISGAMCHPFPVTDDRRKLRMLEVKCKRGMAHNGVLSVVVTKGLSDTATFVRNVMASDSVYKNIDEPAITELLDVACSGSRVVTLDGNGMVRFFGDDWIKDGGIFYSNNSYKWSMSASPVVGYRGVTSWDSETDAKLGDWKHRFDDKQSQMPLLPKPEELLQHGAGRDTCGKCGSNNVECDDDVEDYDADKDSFITYCRDCGTEILYRADGTNFILTEDDEEGEADKDSYDDMWNVVCPVCRLQNHSDENNCVNCGTMLVV